MKVGKLTVEAEPYMGTVVVRGLPGQYVRVELTEILDLCDALKVVAAQRHEAPRPGHVPDDLSQPQDPKDRNTQS